MRHIQYAISREDGLVYSRMGSEAAFPVLEYDRIGIDGNFDKPLAFHLERDSIYSLAPEWRFLVWTKKVPTAIKNIHRAFWGLPPLPLRERDQPHKLPRGVKGLARENWEVKLS